MFLWFLALVLVVDVVVVIVNTNIQDLKKCIQKGHSIVMERLLYLLSLVIKPGESNQACLQSLFVAIQKVVEVRNHQLHIVDFVFRCLMQW